MGKTETAKMFRAEGVPVFEADDYVARLYEEGGLAVDRVGELFPDAIVNGAVDRNALSRELAKRPDAFAALEHIVHPLVREGQRSFLRACLESQAPLAVLDVPLLFETGRERDVDAIVVVTAPAHIQRQRALAREGMTGEKFDMIRSRQIPDSEKRRRARFVIDTSKGLDAARADVRAIIETLRREARARDA